MTLSYQSQPFYRCQGKQVLASFKQNVLLYIVRQNMRIDILPHPCNRIYHSLIFTPVFKAYITAEMEPLQYTTITHIIVFSKGFPIKHRIQPLILWSHLKLFRQIIIDLISQFLKSRILWIQYATSLFLHALKIMP